MGNTIKINPESLRNSVVPVANSAKKSLASARSTLRGISIPGDFPEGGTIRSATSTITSIEAQLDTVCSNVNAIISDQNKAAAANDKIVGNLESIINRLLGGKSISSLIEREKNLANYTGEIDNTEKGDGYDGVYISSNGLKYKDFKQYEGSWADLGYRGVSYTTGERNLMRSHGCLPTSLAIIYSGVLPDLNYTPDIVAGRIDVGEDKPMTCCENAKEDLKANGFEIRNNIEEISNPKTEQIIEELKNNNTLVVYKHNGSEFCERSHYVVAVDVNEYEQVMVLNPGRPYGSGWYDASLLTGKEEDFIWVINPENKK